MSVWDRRIGEVHYSNKGEKVTIIGSSPGKNNRVYHAMFESGFVVKTTYAAIANGRIKDGYSKSLLGVGYLGYAKRKNNEREYSVWFNMLARCYNKKSHSYKWYGERNVTVCERWKCFEYFLGDIVYIPGYEREAFLNGELELDKDIRQQHLQMQQKVYSPETCCFVKHKINAKYMECSNIQNFIAISPMGEIYKESNLKRFCQQHRLTQSRAWDVLNGKHYTTKGWKFIKNEKDELVV
ncbi:hypothetical protein P4284_23420 [Bacillus swezeyi]|uniref:hypothetical protein n=1 Tax=Bacillus swezeyi TaxID=1925020 RepID=UPI002E1A3AC5|nr:hypothetical protein [Bacillus swezeyi]MED2979602.1 hypothetical protein [Bacillus swezeyi]